MSTAAVIYADQLLPRGYGYPLWVPEPDDPCSEVRIGDVGYIWDGSFYTLFNATLPADHPTNRNGVPDNFVPLEFDPAEFIRSRDPFLPEGTLCSKTVKHVGAQTKANIRFISRILFCFFLSSDL